jgi:hypothetical protein
LETPTTLETLDFPQRKWSIQEILNPQIKVVASVQNEFDYLKAKRDILNYNIKAQHGKAQQLKDNLKDTIGGRGTMKMEIKKVECVLSIVISTLNITKFHGKYLQMMGQGGGILELTQGELEHVGQDQYVIEVEYMKVEATFEHA